MNNNDLSNELELHVAKLHTHCIAIIGEPAETSKLVREVLNKLRCDYDHFVDASTMLSIEQLHDYRRRNVCALAEGGHAPTFMSAFLSANGFAQMPAVLVFEHFNSIPPSDSYFVKSLVDANSRDKEDRCYDRLKTVIFILSPVESPNVFDLDHSIRGCIGAVISS